MDAQGKVAGVEGVQLIGEHTCHEVDARIAVALGDLVAAIFNFAEGFFEAHVGGVFGGKQGEAALQALEVGKGHGCKVKTGPSGGFGEVAGAGQALKCLTLMQGLALNKGHEFDTLREPRTQVDNGIFRGSSRFELALFGGGELLEEADRLAGHGEALVLVDPLQVVSANGVQVFTTAALKV